jgi:hypothetical protein
VALQGGEEGVSGGLPILQMYLIVGKIPNHGELLKSNGEGKFIGKCSPPGGGSRALTVRVRHPVGNPKRKV